jgi:diacylglycerol kinase family enzyme
MGRRAALIVNPNAGGGRAAAALPAVEARLAELGVAFHTERTRDLPHGQDLARAAAAAGEVAVTLSGDGLIGAVADALRGTDGGVLGVLPGGRGNDFARVAGIPRDPSRPAMSSRTASSARWTSARPMGGAFIGIASLGFDSDANRIANEAPSRLGSVAYLYAAVRALWAGGRRRSASRSTGGS